MKLSYRQIEPFVKNPDPQARVIVLYGPDAGLVSERAQIIGKTVIADLNDPFQVATLTGDQIAEEPVRLNDEAFAQSLMGGDRLLRIRDAADALKPHLDSYLQDPSPHCLVVVEAGELGPRSSLRLLAEKAPNAAALPCYVEGERDLAGLINEVLGENGLRIERDAQTLLAGLIVGDRVQARSEIEKLALYKLDDPETPVTMDDVRASVGAVRALSTDEFIHAAAAGRLEEAMRLYRVMLAESVPPQTMLRYLQNHLRRLRRVKSGLECGESLDGAMKSLNPPVFFKWADTFKAQVRSWSLPQLHQALEKTRECEVQSKQTGTPVTALTGDLILRIAQKDF